MAGQTLMRVDVYSNWHCFDGSIYGRVRIWALIKPLSIRALENGF